MRSTTPCNKTSSEVLKKVIKNKNKIKTSKDKQKVLKEKESLTNANRYPPLTFVESTKASTSKIFNINL
jgi:hypothetical protein